MPGEFWKNNWIPIVGTAMNVVGGYYSSKALEKQKAAHEKDLYRMRMERESAQQKELLALRNKHDMDMAKFKSGQEARMLALQHQYALDREQKLLQLKDQIESQYYKVPEMNFERYALTATEEAPNLANGGILTEMRKRKEQQNPQNI